MSPTSPLRALAHRNFRLYILGQGVSVIGTWMQQVAMLWLVFQLTGSALWVGMVLFGGQIPALFLTPLAGGLIDRTDRHRLLLLTQSLSMIQAFLLAVLTLTGAVAVWHVIGLAFLLGVINAFDQPARQSFLIELIGTKDDLANAIALNSSVFNGARLVGPAIAGVMLSLTSAGGCFLVNGLTYFAVLAALLAMSVSKRQPLAASAHLLGGVREGIAYAWTTTRIRSLLLTIALFNMAGMAETTLLPLLSTAVLEGDSRTLGLLSAAGGLGAFAAAAFLASRRSALALEKWIVLAAPAFGLGLVILSFTGTLWAAALMLGATGFALLLMTATANTVLQTTVAEDKRGRIMSLYTMAVTGLAPLGGLVAGLVADEVGPSAALRVAGLICLAGSALFAARSPRSDTSSGADSMQNTLLTPAHAK